VRFASFVYISDTTISRLFFIVPPQSSTNIRYTSVILLLSSSPNTLVTRHSIDTPPHKQQQPLNNRLLRKRPQTADDSSPFSDIVCTCDWYCIPWYVDHRRTPQPHLRAPHPQSVIIRTNTSNRPKPSFITCVSERTHISYDPPCHVPHRDSSPCSCPHCPISNLFLPTSHSYRLVTQLCFSYLSHHVNFSYLSHHVNNIDFLPKRIHSSILSSSLTYPF
jgi:hypothetical protein